MRYIWIILLLILLLNSDIFAQQSSTETQIGIDEKLGDYVPLDLVFYDETGKKVTLKEIANNKPVILSLVYFRCPGICSPLMNGLADVINDMKLKAGKDFTVITVSFDPKENYKLASDKKRNYFNTFKIPASEDGWRFLTGEEDNINKITKSVGFYYKEEDGQYVHAAAIYVLSPEGKISRYLYGIKFLPLDAELAVFEASQGKVGTTVNKVLSLCYSYNPKSKKYVFNITKIAGIIILILIGIFIAYLVKTNYGKIRLVKSNGK